MTRNGLVRRGTKSRRGLLYLAVFLAILTATARSSAEKLKAHYSGSSMATDSSSRVVTIEFEKDGTGLYQEHSGKGETSSPIHWSRAGKIVTIALEPAPGKEPDAPLTFELKRKSLAPVTAKDRKLGIFGFPTLSPFGAESVGTSSGMTTCVTGAPGPCLMRETWNSNKSRP